MRRLFLILLWPFMAMADDGWSVSASLPQPGRYHGVTVANGMIGLVSSPTPFTSAEVVLNGAYDDYGRGRVENILHVFRFMDLQIAADGEGLTALPHRQRLDMRGAAFETELANGKLRVHHRLAALRHLPFNALATIDIEALAETELSVSNAIAAPGDLRDVHQGFSHIDRPHVRLALMSSQAASPGGKLQVAASSAFVFDEREGPTVLHEDWDHDQHRQRFTRHLKKGEHWRFALVGAVLSSAHVADARNEAERLTLYAALEGSQRLQAAHQRAWDHLWQSDVRIDGAPEVQRDMRLALYHLYSFVRADSGYSLSPMGLSGLGYNGHVFWDAELWMYPPLLATHPELARSLLDYRYNHLEAARRNASSHGYAGAMFPWESAASGQEVTPVWALTGPFQQHITGCIGWAVWQYYRVTQDRAWLRERGYPMLKAVADFWASRVERKAPGQYEINNVIGPDEWQENIDNNAFTNGLAITVLRAAGQAAQLVGETANPDWAHVAANIPIPHFADGTTRQHARYDGVPIKQADVNLLAYPLEFISDPAQTARDLAYYAPRLSPQGPAMSWSIPATIHARSGHLNEAYQAFLKSYQPNRLPPFGVLAETAGGDNPYFATGAGGTLQALLFGFGGLAITDAGLQRGPVRLPPGWKNLELKLAH